MFFQYHSKDKDKIKNNLSETPEIHSERVEQWMSQFEFDKKNPHKCYYAHAMRAENLKNIIDEGYVWPTEYLLRQAKLKQIKIEGRQTCSGEFIEPIELDQEQIQALKTLTPENQERLDELIQEELTNPFTDNERLQWKQLKQAVRCEMDQERNKFLLNQPNWNKWDKFRRATSGKILKKLQITAPELHKKYTRNQEIKYWNRLKQGIMFQPSGIDISGLFWYRSIYLRQVILKSIVKDTTKKQFKLTNRIAENLIALSFDEALRKEGLGLIPYMLGKYTKWMEKYAKDDERIALSIRVIMYDMRIFSDMHHQSTDCIYDVVYTMKNDISWSYGSSVIVRGNKEGAFGYIRCDMLSEETLGEHILQAPWQNKGAFFGLPLANEYTILIGPKKDLEPYVDTLKHQGVLFAFLEWMSPKQLAFFKTPKQFYPTQKDLDKEQVLSNPTATTTLTIN